MYTPKRTPKTVFHGRSAATQRQVEMLRDKGLQINKNGLKTGGLFLRSEATTDGRIAPNRKWFGNTRVISQRQLEEFRTEVQKRIDNPREIVLKQRKLPMALLKETRFDGAKSNLLEVESFEQTFGSTKTSRNRPTIEHDSLEAMVKAAQEASASYTGVSDRDTAQARYQQSIDHGEAKDAAFVRAQTKRVFAELYKVIDCSDVLIQVLDARDPIGTRSANLESYLKKPENEHKHLILVLNKCDLVPPGVTKRWLKLLSKEHPVVAYKASVEQPFGKGSLISLLRQYAQAHRDKQQITVGLAGYPNVGKSSLINSLVGKKACVVAPVPGQTKVWQYVCLTQRINLVDCPGVVRAERGRSTAPVDLLLRSVIRPERIETPDIYIPELLQRTNPGAIAHEYKLPPLSLEDPEVRQYFEEHGDTITTDGNGFCYWLSPEDFLERVAVRTGRLLKGNNPDIEAVARIVLRDWQRGKIRWFYAPPEAELADLEDDEDLESESAAEEEAEAPIAAEDTVKVEEAAAEEEEDSSEGIDWDGMFGERDDANEDDIVEKPASAAEEDTAESKANRIKSRDISLTTNQNLEIVKKPSRRRKYKHRSRRLADGENSSRFITFDDHEISTKNVRKGRGSSRTVEQEAKAAKKRQERRLASTKRKTGSQFYAEARTKRQIIAKKIGHRVA